MNEAAKSKGVESDPYCNESTKKPVDKNDVLRDVSSLSSMDAGTDNKNNGNQLEDKEREVVKSKLNSYPSNNNYPRKLTKREKKTNAATKSIEE